MNSPNTKWQKTERGENIITDYVSVDIPIVVPRKDGCAVLITAHLPFRVAHITITNLHGKSGELNMGNNQPKVATMNKWLITDIRGGCIIITADFMLEALEAALNYKNEPDDFIVKCELYKGNEKAINEL